MRCLLALLPLLVSLPLQAVDLVVVEKAQRTMTLYQDGQEVKRFHIAMGDSPSGHKLQEGDQRTPQGRYILDYKKQDSAYYRSIHISYPNAADRLRAEALGVSPGGQIMIHGENPNSALSPEEQQAYNWTNGCIAVTNKEMDQLWQLIRPGTPIEIWP
ncbi:L,D-transpeptidase family protein [Shewanella sp. GXUN23E]|uniref:L,D-transpeptidase family protein n=1 Tax=Shewanella sp. GXUN23E TaxID=3422498 RepID=UPI003D7CEF81